MGTVCTTKVRAALLLQPPNVAAVTPLRGGGERIILSLELVSNPNISLVGRVINDVKDSLSYFGWQNVFFPAVCLPIRTSFAKVNLSS